VETRSDCACGLARLKHHRLRRTSGFNVIVFAGEQDANDVATVQETEKDVRTILHVSL
jgi:hypothetical protein